MKLKLEDAVVSPQDLAELTSEVRKYARWFAQTSVKMRLADGKSYEPPAVAPAAIKLIKEWSGGKQLTQKNLDDLIEELETFKAKAPRVTITLAAVPPGSLKKTLVAWCRKNIDPDVLLELNFNSTLLGGMVVRYGSRIHDWSFRRQILAAREKFPEALRNV